MITTSRFLATVVALSAIATIATPAFAQAPAGQPARPTASVNQQPRVDVLNMPRPIDMHDSVWIEDLTMMEVRDLLKAGKTTALILTGGIEENGPYLTTGKHNNVLRVTGNAIARSLGNALVAPIVTLEPGNPERVRTPGTVLLSPETYISSIIMVHDTDGVRMPERVKAGKFVINGVSLAPAEKTIENGKKIVAFRTEKTVAAIKKAMETAKSTAQ